MKPQSKSTPLRAGCPQYLNCVPFLDGISEQDVEIVYGPPSTMYSRLVSDLVDACFMPVATAHRLGDKVKPLGNLGIATHAAAQSVLLFSDLPVGELGGHKVALTAESATSVELTKLIFKELWRVGPIEYVGLDQPAKARLLIGDSALRTNAHSRPAHLYDLGLAWRELTGSPFVFARWMCKVGIEADRHQRLTRLLNTNLEHNLGNLEGLAASRAGEPITTRQLVNYWSNFKYQLGEPELDGMRLFTQKLDSSGHYA